MSQNLFSSSDHRVGSGNKVASFFKLFDDISSKFTRHIAPAFNHERPERTVQMRLYTLQKGQHLLIFVMLSVLLFIAFLMGMAGPRIIKERTDYATQLQGSGSLPKGPFFLLTPLLSFYHRQMWISAEIITKKKDQDYFSKHFWVSIKLEGIFGGEDNTPVQKVQIGPSHNRSRSLQCNSNSCDSFIVAHLGVLRYPRYLVSIQFSDELDSINKHFTITDIILTTSTYNPQFTEMEILFRFFFILTTLGTGVFVVISLGRFGIEDWSIEQKWLLGLIPLLLGFNNPFFPVTILSDRNFPVILEVFFQATFLFSLLLFWLIVFHGLRQTDRTFYSFYLPKFIIVGSLWFSGITMATLEEINQLRDPTFSFQLDAAHYKKFQAFFTVFLTFYAFYLAYLMLRAFGELRSMNLIQSRLKFHASSIILISILTISIIFSRYGSGVLEDNFIAKIYTSYESEGQFLAFYTGVNVYVYVLAYVYTPTSYQSTLDSQILKDNPAFSMINESDDETEAMLIPGDAARSYGDSDKIKFNEEYDDSD